MNKRLTREQRIINFWSRVDSSGGPDACHPWTAGQRGNGYGCFRLDGKQMPAHQVAWVLTKGPIPKKKIVRHKVCDFPLCCNVRHMRLGTKKQNTQDMLDHGRVSCGERHPSSKLKLRQVRIIPKPV